MAKEQYANTKVIRQKRTSAKLEVSNSGRRSTLRVQSTYCTRFSCIIAAEIIIKVDPCAM